MNLTDFLRKEGQLWSRFRNNGTEHVETSTVVCSPWIREGNVVHSHHRTGDLANWPDHSTIEIAHQDAATRLLRVVWVERNTTEQIDYITAADLTQIVALFGLRTAQEHYPTAFAGIERVPDTNLEPNKDFVQYCFRLHPKVVALWSVSPDQRHVQGVCFAGKDQISRLKNLLDPSWHDYTTLLPVACATMLSIEIDETQKRVKSDISSVEARTGHHKWKSRKEPSAIGDLGSLSALMSGSATKIAAAVRKSQVVEQLLEFLETHCSDQKREIKPSRGSDEQPALTGGVQYLKRRTRMQNIDFDLIRERINIQLSALCNLIAQNDGLSNLQTAEESKKIAVASQRDSTSMKALAAVTMFYLPAQVVASIFAIPFFHWSESTENSMDSGRLIDGRFGVYWAVTLPLTLATFAVAGVWLLIEHRYISPPNRAVRLDSSAFYGGDEVNLLLQRRATTKMTSKSLQ